MLLESTKVNAQDDLRPNKLPTSCFDPKSESRKLLKSAPKPLPRSTGFGSCMCDRVEQNNSILSSEPVFELLCTKACRVIISEPRGRETLIRHFVSHRLG